MTLPLAAQQQQEAKALLDKTAAAYTKAGGVKVDFQAKAFSKGREQGGAQGTIQLKGEKFLLKTAEASTWFDGRTQWSYLTGSDEVNISTPTPSELQSINPYALLQLYRKGYTYRLGATKRWNGQAVQEVELQASNSQEELSRIVLRIDPKSYQPLYIELQMRDKSRSEITITGYRSGLKYADSLFQFDRKQYPNAEIIDLR